MLIALDFDGTYTRDPDGWRQFVSMMKERGHAFVCVTGRPPIGWLAAEVANELSECMPIIFAGPDWKREIAEKAGFNVDVWIDDCPTMIEKQNLL